MTRGRALALGFGLALGLALGLGPFEHAALAGEPDEERARTLFRSGVDAYKEGHFLEAAQAFLQADALFPQPELDFSIGQAFRREFAVDPKPEYARAAGEHFRAFVAVVKEGPKVLEASRALGDLAAYLTPGEALAMRFPTRLGVQSAAEGAVASVDGGAVRRLPLRLEVSPGSHRVVVHATGYASATREVQLGEGEMVAVDVPLRADPALLTIAGAEGAEVTVDGRPFGKTPLAVPVEVPLGRHLVSVAAAGSRTYAGELEFGRGATTHVELELPTTNQRRAAYGLFATAGAALASAAACGGAAVAEQSVAKDLLAKQDAGAISEAERLDYNRALALRDDLRLAALATSAAGVGVGLVGLFIFFLESPETVTPTPQLAPRTPEDGAPAPRAPDVEMMGLPGGIGVSARF